MYTFLNQRYGLRSLTISHAASIIKAIKQYSPDDFEALQFGKMLRSNIPESYPLLVNQLKKAAADQVKHWLWEKHPSKNEPFILDQQEKIFSGQLHVDGGLYSRILNAVDGY